MKHVPGCPVAKIRSKEELENYVVVFREYIVKDDNFKQVKASVKCIICNATLAEKEFERR